MPLDVPTALLERATPGPVDDAEFHGGAPRLPALCLDRHQRRGAGPAQLLSRTDELGPLWKE